jgi:ABC-type branched-subunit amino acid transport system ATPase component/sugar phosphate permease
VSLRRLTAPASMIPLVVLAGLGAMTQFETAAFSVLLPDIRQSFHLSLAALSTITAVAAPFGLLLDIPVAYAGDRVNRIRMTCIGFFLFMAFSAFTGFAGLLASLPLLYLARIGTSIGGAFQSTGASLMADYYPVAVRPRVYFARAAVAAAMGAVAPATVGLLELRFSWPQPFFLLAAPTVIFIVAGLRLREPVRGRHEREMMGADQATADVADEPASLSETFRTLFANPSMRRLYYSLPFLTVAAIGIGQFTSLFYQQILHLDASQRGFLLAATEPGAVLGLILGGVVIRPMILSDPGRVVRLIALSSTAAGVILVGFALAPNVAVAGGLQFLLSGVMATIVPGLTTVLSLVIPPRMRTLGFATGSIWLLLGLPVLPLAGGIGDRFGLRTGIIVFVPVFLLGAYILASGGRYIAGDIEKVRVSTTARAEIRRQRLDGHSPLLVARAVRAGYGQLDVLFDVNLDVADGEMLALLGTNGAGKSTLLRVVSALIVPSAGAVMYDGIDITSADPRRIVELGVVHVPGGRGVFPGLTVRENLLLARRHRHRGPALGQRRRDRAALVSETVAVFPALTERIDTRAGELSGGEQQMLSLAQAFLVRPRLLLIDELSLGLAPGLVDSLVERVKAVNAAGTAVVVVDQSLSTAAAVSERAAFMERGQVRFLGPIAELLARPDLARAVFFPAVAARAELAVGPLEAKVARPAAVLSAGGLTKSYGGNVVLRDVDLRIGDGEVVGLIGPNGAGKSTLLDLLTGVQSADSGTVSLGGTDISRWSTHRRAGHGLARSFQDPRLWAGLRVDEALALGVSRRHRRSLSPSALAHLPSSVRRERAVNAEVEELIELLHLGDYRSKFPTELSTGTRRIVELATVVAQRPRILLLDEPTAGIAQKETAALAELLERVRAMLGCALLVIEHDLDFVQRLATRLVAMDAGAVLADGTPAEVLGDARVVEAYFGTQDAGWASHSGTAPA